VLECKNASCPKKLSGKIGRWISSLDILGIGDVVLEALIEQLRIEDAADLYKLHSRFDAMAEMLTHPGRDLRLGSKRTASILAAIESKRILSLSQFLGSLGIEHLGKRRVELMIAAAQGELDTLGDWRSGKLRDAQIAERAGVPNIALRIQDDIDGMAGVIDKMLANGVKVNNLRDAAQARAAGGIGAAGGAEAAGEAGAAGGAEAAGGAGDTRALGTTVCISGKLPSGRKKADYAAPLMAAGYTLVDEVTRDLRLLVLADPDSTSAKAEKARKLGITIIGETQLETLIAQ